MILDGRYVGVFMRVAEYTVDCAVALGAPLGFGRATDDGIAVLTRAAPVHHADGQLALHALPRREVQAASR